MTTETKGQQPILDKANIIVKMIMTIAPDVKSVENDIGFLKVRYPNASKDKLANWFANRSRKFYTAYGVVSALPSLIPGIGTAVQVGIEAGTIMGDLAYMIRHMARMSMGIAAIYGHDLNGFDAQEFLKLLGYWCGALCPIGDALVRFGAKTAIKIIDKNITSETIKKINQKIGITLVTKYGTKRGGISLGRTIPFGIGAIIGGAFNYATMTGFKKAAINWFREPIELFDPDFDEQ